MDNTIFKANQHKKIITILINSGSFAISDIERGNIISREQIGKILKTLSADNSLAKTSKTGSGVKYKLATTNEGISFLLNNIDQVTIENIANAWDVSIASAKKYIKKFVDSNLVEKIGKPPKKINYILAKQKGAHQYQVEEERAIERNFIYITPDGRSFDGIRGFEKFIISKYGKQTTEGIDKVARKYLEVRDEYYGLNQPFEAINATNKLKQTFNENAVVEKIFYGDLDELPIFEKTKLYQLVTIAKSGHKNTELMMKIVSEMQNNINNIIEKYKIEAVGFIPPTIMRKTQLMSFIQNRLNFNTPLEKINIHKVDNLLPVPQKSLQKLKDRKLNAKNSITVSSSAQYESILLIDDVVGSGATINETAKKILNQGIAQKVYAFAITGSAKPGQFEIVPTLY